MTDTTTPVTGTPATTTTTATQQYLVISAGLDDNKDGVIDEGGKILAFPLTPIVGVTAEMILKVLGITDNEVHAELPITIPAYRLNIFGLIIKDKPIAKNFEIEVQIVDEAGLTALKSSIGIDIKF